MTEEEAKIAWEFFNIVFKDSPDSGYRLRRKAGNLVYNENGIATWCVWSDTQAVEFYDILSVASFVVDNSYQNWDE